MLLYQSINPPSHISNMPGYSQIYNLSILVTIAMEDGSSVLHGLSQSFPDELIVDILKRLPVKSLLRFRSVSKSWRSLISTPAFIRLHLEAAIKNSRYSHNRLFCIFTHHRLLVREYSLRYLFLEYVADPVIQEYIAPNTDMTMRLVGSCRGLLCISLREDHFVLWNPSIKKHKCIPCLRVHGMYSCFMNDGFGYVESTDDYKVVTMFYCVFHAGPYEVHVYSNRTDEWRRIEDFELGMPLDNSGKYANGNLHWLVDCDGSLDVVSLDLATESYGRLGVPNNDANRLGGNPGPGDSCITLGLFSGNLCLLYDDHRVSMDLWVMNEYGNRDSWSRLFRLPQLGTPGFYPHMLRLWSIKNGKILLLYGGIIIFYTPGINAYCFPPISDVASLCQADMYVESLISPGDA